MRKEEAIKNFLRGLRIAFINAGVYQKEHPVYQHSIGELKAKLDDLFLIAHNMDIGIKPGSLKIDEFEFREERLHIDLARFFHVRKIKLIHFSPGVSLEELGEFCIYIAGLNKEKDIHGKIQETTKSGRYKHIIIKELDYSGLLGLKGGDKKEDIWAFLLKDVGYLSRRDDEKRFITDFRKALKETDFSSISHNDSALNKLESIIDYLRENWPQQIQSVSRELFEAVMDKGKSVGDSIVLDRLRNIIRGLRRDQAIDALWKSVFKADDFNPLAFGVFNQLTGRNEEKDLSLLWEEKLKTKGEFLPISMLRDKVKKLLIVKERGELIPEMYQDTLAFLMNRIKQEDTFLFDRQKLLVSYFYVLLNLLSWEQSADTVREITGKILDEWKRMRLVLHPKAFDDFLEVVNGKMAVFGNRPVVAYLKQCRETFLNEIEEIIIDRNYQVSEEELDNFLKTVKKSKFSTDFYLNKIWAAGGNKKYLLKMFFTFFPNSADAMRARIRAEQKNKIVLNKVIQALGEVDQIYSFTLLKDIYIYADHAAKIQVLRAIRNLSRFDIDFLRQVLTDRSPFIRREALRAVKERDKDLIDKAVTVLLGVGGFFGFNNGTLGDNIKILADERVEEARGRVEALLSRRFLWGGERIYSEANSYLSKCKGEKDV